MIYDIIVFKNLCFRPSTRKRKAGVFKAKISTLESVFEKIRFQWLFSPDTCGRWAKPGGDIRFQTKSDTCGRVGPNTVKFRKWSPGLMFFEGPFWGAYVRREICVSKSTGLAFFLEGNLPFFFVILCFWGQFPSTSPGGGGAYIWRGDLTKGFGGNKFAAASFWRGLFSEFYRSFWIEKQWH